MRKLNGTVYIGGGCNLYEENGQIHSVEDGEYICQKWNGSEFETLTIVQLLQMITITAIRGECLVNCFTAKNVIW